MKCDLCGGTIVDREVSYTIEFKGRLHIYRIRTNQRVFAMWRKALLT